MDADPVLTVREVAARLKVSPDTVRTWIEKGTLRGAMLGGTKLGYRITETELRRFRLERGL